jgi:hypothetical protein
MSDDPGPSRVRIDAAELHRVDISDDGGRLHLRLRDQAGRDASVSLPADCVGAIVDAVPRLATGAVHWVDGWSLDRVGDGWLLTLRLPGGATFTFAVKPWQIAAIASLAGQDLERGDRRLN